MTTLLLRTLLIYVVLMIAMRMMGKRQIGELEVSDLITTLLISEIASLPITDSDIPVSHAVVPIVMLMTFEVATSTLVANVPRVKKWITARPAKLIDNGRICQAEMKKARISADELISELRQREITELAEVRYAILEPNGKISVLPYSGAKPPTADQLKLDVADGGLSYVIIDKGTVNAHNQRLLSLSDKRLRSILRKEGVAVGDVYLMMMNDSGEATVIRREGVTG